MIYFTISYSFGKFFSMYQSTTSFGSGTPVSSSRFATSFISINYSSMLIELIFLVEKNFSIRCTFLGLL